MRAFGRPLSRLFLLQARAVTAHTARGRWLAAALGAWASCPISRQVTASSSSSPLRVLRTKATSTSRSTVGRSPPVPSSSASSSASLAAPPSVSFSAPSPLATCYPSPSGRSVPPISDVVISCASSFCHLLSHPSPDCHRFFLRSFVISPALSMSLHGFSKAFWTPPMLSWSRPPARRATS